MTKKDYVAFAKMLKDLKTLDNIKTNDNATLVKKNDVVNGIADVFKKDNINFDKDRFFEFLVYK